MAKVQSIVPCLWFDTRAEEAAKFYTGLFPNSRVESVTHYTEAGQEIHGKKPGSVMTVDFVIDGMRVTALNGGPNVKFTEALSLQVMCDTQEEVDRYWAALSEGDDPKAQECGWLKDRFGLSWQIVPQVLNEMILDPDKERVSRVLNAMFPMKKLEIAPLVAAYEGK